MATMCGGLGSIVDADANIQAIVDQVLDSVNTQTGNKYSKLTAVKYGSQVVAGTNYFVKVLTDDNKYLHLRIFQALPHTNAGPELASLQKDKTEEEIVAYFG